MSEADSNYRETDDSIRGVENRASADALRDLVECNLKLRQQDHIVRVEERQDGTFDVVVLVRVN